MSSSIFADLLTNSVPGRYSTDHSSDTDDLSSLPFPQPISRPVFSSESFNTESFLLSHSQFRTLDDLRSELRGWVDKLESEMETLIEGDWQGYLMLGRGLVGGQVHVKEAERRIKATEREVQTVKRRIEKKINEVDGLLLEKKKTRGRADLARRLLAVHSALQTLEKGLFLQVDDYATTDDDVSLYSTDRLKRLVSQYRELTYLITKIPLHPFITTQHVRIRKVKETLQRDLQDAIRTGKKENDTNTVFTLLKLCSSIDLTIKP